MKKEILLTVALLLNIYAEAQFQKIKKTETSKPVANPVMVNTATPVIKNTVPGSSAYDFSKVRICVDQSTTVNNLPPRNNNAGKPVPKINPDGSLSAPGVIQQGLVGASEKMWNPGDVITVWLSPYTASDLLRKTVQFYAKEWEKYANIKFEFIDDFKSAKIKVGFYPTGQSWSWIGRDVTSNPFNAYTMNLGWFDEKTKGLEFSRMVTHEFGHALGFHHEHQSPVSPLQWNLEKTYRYFKETSNWSAIEVDFNVINKYNQHNTNYSDYDKNSIMNYHIPDELLLSGSGTSGNYWISQTDAKYAGYWFPFPPAGKNTTGNLRTNDDCDDVVFSVEYNAIATDKVEFILSLGETNRDSAYQ